MTVDTWKGEEKMNSSIGYESSMPFYFNIKNETLWYIRVEKLNEK